MKSLLLIGTGLIGCSFARAARANGVFDHVVGIDHDQAALGHARELGIVDAVANAPCDDHDAVCVAVPVGAIAAKVREVASRCAGPVFDVGSVKGPVIDALDPVPPNFVPCHPIAGSEHQGPLAARTDLFEGHALIMTPVAETDRAAVDAVRGYWEAVGARVVERTPASHDECFALVSHLPHLVAFAFIDTAIRARPLDQVGNGFRDFVRIAGADVDVWTDILHANATRIRPRLDELMGALERFGKAMEQGGESLQECIESAVSAKRAFDETDH
ncbi:MAG: prephenate dehydrogenase/arogenate dehydrogenase family protein [Gammaproteobacteria bacterium]|nr:prephenate dehydrogenase/arogenate dehydrogenase family protein [Gammaproteobacteria bacterium]MYJ75563.1 prephenate dehydrogenase/arogenate dehydrogenase family protein [Gammaproteobacteria bacterium]